MSWKKMNASRKGAKNAKKEEFWNTNITNHH
jgi:hypothetical protein